MKINSFPPIVNEQSKILILGTMPGNDSLKHHQYYAHPQNAFWKILFSLTGITFSENYIDKQNLLLNNHIALWDVLKSCIRNGSSLDSKINNEEPNDIMHLLQQYPKIKHLFFNGKQAEKYFKKHSNTSIPSTTLSSTSPANAISFNKKLNEWRIIENHIQ